MNDDPDRVTFNENGTLDEVCGTGFAHLEHMDKNSWFLLIGHADGTETAIWFSSKDLKRPFWEKRGPQQVYEKERK